MLSDKKIGFIGGGQMCEAIFSGAVASHAVLPENILITDLNHSRLTHLHEKYGVGTFLNDADNAGAKEVLTRCDLVIFALKPQFAGPVLAQITAFVRPEQLILSIMGGVSLSLLEGYFSQNPVIRIMPNTPMLVCKGVAGIALGKNATSADCALAKELFDLVGISYVLPEALIDPLTSISGCGPAFAYLFMEAMADGGVEKGMPRDMAIRLAAQALAGSAEMVLQTGLHPAALKDSVCSPGGSTIVGIHTLEQGAFRATVMNAVTQSCDKMAEVGKKA